MIFNSELLLVRQRQFLLLAILVGIVGIVVGGITIAAILGDFLNP